MNEVVDVVQPNGLRRSKGKIRNVGRGWRQNSRKGRRGGIIRTYAWYIKVGYHSRYLRWGIIQEGSRSPHWSLESVWLDFRRSAPPIEEVGKMLRFPNRRIILSKSTESEHLFTLINEIGTFTLIDEIRTFTPIAEIGTSGIIYSTCKSRNRISSFAPIRMSHEIKSNRKSRLQMYQNHACKCTMYVQVHDIGKSRFKRHGSNLSRTTISPSTSRCEWEAIVSSSCTIAPY